MSRALSHKIGRKVAGDVARVEKDDVVEVQDLFEMRTPDEHMCIVKHEPTILSVMLNALIDMENKEK